MNPKSNPKPLTIDVQFWDESTAYYWHITVEQLAPGRYLGTLYRIVAGEDRYNREQRGYTAEHAYESLRQTAERIGRKRWESETRPKELGR